ncbi:hypothetical protein [Variovorax sp. PvP013]|uniref:hypothetical protein n=1 Tax=Variovorax sp. PvP013 TaxID=3156435 RepID=UPI003D2078AF
MIDTLIGRTAWRWVRTVSVVRVLALSCALLTASSAFSFDHWIGRPTMGDYMRASVQDAIASAQQYQKAIGSFQGDIDRSRKAFFEASRWNRAAAGDEFGKYLFAKDIMIATPMLANGFSDHAQGVGRLFAALNGNRVVDGGIRPTARASYEAWIRAMRTSMGARGETDVVFMNQAKFMAALQSSQDVYNTYRQERDLAESRGWRSLNPPEAERVGSRPLRRPGEEITVVMSLTLERIEQAFMTSEVDVAQKAGARRLRCEYGPSYDENGVEQFGRYDFWKGKPPPNIARLMAFDSHAPGGVRDQAVSSCPKQEAEASRLMKLPLKTEVPAMLRDEVRAQQQGARQAERVRLAIEREDAAKARSDAKARRDAENLEIYQRNMKAGHERMLAQQQAYQESISPSGRARAAAAAAAKTPEGAATNSTAAATGSTKAPATLTAGLPGQRPPNDYRRFSEEIRQCDMQYREAFAREGHSNRAAGREERRQCQRRAEVVSGLR